MALERLRNNPFRTPDGYFQHLNQRIIHQVDTHARLQQKKATAMPLSRRGRWYLAAAASVMTLFALTSVYTGLQQYAGTPQNAHQITTMQASSLPMDALDMAADYTMCDNDDVLAFLLDE